MATLLDSGTSADLYRVRDRSWDRKRRSSCFIPLSWLMIPWTPQFEISSTARAFTIPTLSGHSMSAATKATCMSSRNIWSVGRWRPSLKLGRLRSLRECSKLEQVCAALVYAHGRGGVLS